MRAAFAIAVVALVAPAEAAPSGYRTFRSYDSDDGLGALDLDVGVQDRDGFIWAASPNGLFRFDGAHFRRFGVDDGLPSTLVTDLVVGPDGVLWGATSRGVVSYKGDRFVALDSSALPVDGLHRLAFDRMGRLWVTTDAGPYIFQNGRFELAPAWLGGGSFAIFVEADGTVLVGRGSHLVSWDPRRGWADGGRDFGAPITHILRDGEDRLWMRAGKFLWMQPHPDAPFEDRSDLDGARVVPTNVRLSLDARGHLLVPTEDGLVEIADGRARRLPTNLAEDALNIKSVWVDREGALWITSLGLHHELGRGLWRARTTQRGLPSNNVWGITGMRDGRVAVATNSGVVLLTDDATEQVTDRAAFATVEDDEGGLWIATDTLVRRDPNKTLRAFGPDDGLPAKPARTLGRSSDGRIWVGLDAGGLFRTVTGRFDKLEEVVLPDVGTVRVWSISPDGDRLWVTTSAGLFVREGERWRRFAARDGLLADDTTFLAVRRNHDVCVSYLSVEGVQCLRYDAGRVTTIDRFHESFGLTSPIPYFLGEDHEGRLWVGGARGVAIIDKHVEQFGRRSGMPGDDCNSGAMWVAPDGHVWVGTSTGLGIFDARRYHLSSAPRVTLLAGQLGARTVVGSTWSSFETRRPHVPHDHGRLSVEFAALSFLDPRGIEYEVQLEGFDDDWRAIDHNTVRYDHLPAGSYVFRVRARQGAGVWGPETVVPFVVENVWWGTWWFRGLAILVGILLIAGIVRWRSGRLRHQNSRLGVLVEERTKELARANEQVVLAEKLAALGRVMAQLSHELNNPLNVVLNNLAPLQEYMATLRMVIEKTRDLTTDPAARASLDLLWSQHELGFVFEDSTQAFAIMGDAVNRLSRIHADIRVYLRGQRPTTKLVDIGPGLRSIVSTFARSNADVEIHAEIPPLPLVELDEIRIQQTITNLFQNAVDAMGGKGRISLHVEVDQTCLRLRIADSGPGIPPEMQSRVFEPFFTTKDVGKGLGLGLAICHETIVAHGGTLTLDTSVEQGACFVISLPLWLEHVDSARPDRTFVN